MNTFIAVSIAKKKNEDIHSGFQCIISAKFFGHSSVDLLVPPHRMQDLIIFSLEHPIRQRNSYINIHIGINWIEIALGLL